MLSENGVYEFFVTIMPFWWQSAENSDTFLHCGDLFIKQFKIDILRVHKNNFSTQMCAMHYNDR